MSAFEALDRIVLFAKHSNLKALRERRAFEGSGTHGVSPALFSFVITRHGLIA